MNGQQLSEKYWRVIQTRSMSAESELKGEIVKHNKRVIAHK
jgi:hypothetical protein